MKGRVGQSTVLAVACHAQGTWSVNVVVGIEKSPCEFDNAILESVRVKEVDMSLSLIHIGRCRRRV